MKPIRFRLLVLLVHVGGVFLACSGSDQGGDGDGGVAASGGRDGATASGGSNGQKLDRDGRAANCDGMIAEQSETCSKAELVCQSNSGILCICGGVPPETGEIQGTPTGNGMGFRSGAVVFPLVTLGIATVVAFPAEGQAPV